MKRLIYLLLLTSCAWAQTHITAANINGTFYSNQFTSIQSALNAMGSNSRLYVHPGRYTGPTTFQPNQEVICDAPPMAGTIAGSFNAHSTATDQCVFLYTSTLVLSRLFNLHFVGITFDFQANPAGLELLESAWNIFDDCAIVHAGSFSSAMPAALWNASNTATYNTAHNIFRNLNVWPNAGSIGIELIGSGTANAGPSVTDNTFIKTTVTNNWLYGVDFELNTDTNYFYGLECNEIGSAPTGSACVAFNSNNAVGDNDADGMFISGMFITGTPTYNILAGPSTGNQIYMTSPGTPVVGTKGGATAQSISIHTQGLFGTNTYETIGGNMSVLGNGLFLGYASMGPGDATFARTATTGDIFLGTDGASIFRNPNNIFIENLNFGFGSGKGQHFVTQAANNDYAGTCTAASATTCVVTFTTAFNNPPVCTVTDQTTAANGALKALPTTTNLTITTTSSSDTFSYICVGNPN